MLCYVIMFNMFLKVSVTLISSFPCNFKYFPLKITTNCNYLPLYFKMGEPVFMLVSHNKIIFRTFRNILARQKLGRSIEINPQNCYLFILYNFFITFHWPLVGEINFFFQFHLFSSLTAYITLKNSNDLSTFLNSWNTGYMVLTLEKLCWLSET